MVLDILSLRPWQFTRQRNLMYLTAMKSIITRQSHAQVDDEEELKRAALDNFTKSQRTFKYPIKETEDENGKVSNKQ